VVVSSVVANPKNAAMGIVLLGTGIVVYAAWRRISGGQAGRETLSG
jgi:hypothetical protein